MPWTAKSGNVYKLYLLDTNAISEILKYPKREGFGLTKVFPPSEFVPCFSLYSIIELRRKIELYEKFINFFSIYSLLLLKSQSSIFSEELENYGSDKEILPIFNAFTPLGIGESYNLHLFLENIFNDNQISNTEKSWRNDEFEIIESWKKNKKNFVPKYSYPNKEDAEKYVNAAAPESLARMNIAWVRKMVETGIFPDINYFPSLKIMLYSLYYRLYDPSWKESLSEATDLRIVSSVPYVDCFITEKFQANINSKIKNDVKGMDKVQTLRIRDLR